MTKHNIWSISIIGLLFALLFTPFIVAQTLYFPYVTGKVFVFRSIVTTLFILWTILVYKKPEFLPKKSVILGVSGIFILWLAIANIFGIDPSNSFFSNFERMEGWFTHAYLFLFLIVISSVLQTEKLWNWFFGISVMAANIIALYATFDSSSRTQIFLGNSTYVAVYMLFNVFFSLLLIYRIYKQRFEIFSLKYASIIYYLSSILLFVYIIFKTQTRGTVLAVVFSALLFLILSAISYWKNKKVRIISSLAILLIIVGSIFFWQNKESAFIQNNPLLVRITTISPTEGTGKARLVNWGIALEGIKSEPLLGWGQENYGYVFAQKYDPQMYGQEPWFDRTHNAFLDWAIQGGIPAALIYLLLFASVIYVIKVSTSLARIEKNILISLIVAYGIHNMFVFDNYSSYLMFFAVLGFVIHHSQKEKIKIDWDEKTKQIVSICVIAVLCITAWVVIIKPYTVAHNLIKALTQKDGYAILDIYQDIFDKHTFGTTEASIKLLSDASSFAKVDNKDFQKAYFDLANQTGENLIIAHPQDVRLLESYGSYLLQVDNSSSSITVLEKARTLAPNRQNNLYMLGLAYIDTKQYAKAEEVFKHAYEILPENQKAKTYYGAALLLNGNPLGKELVQGYSHTDQFFLSVFSKTKQYKEIIKIREQLKIDKPTDYQNQISLAVVYVLDGQRIKAIQIIREVQKAVPEFKGQGDALIRDIQLGKKIV